MNHNVKYYKVNIFITLGLLVLFFFVIFVSFIGIIDTSEGLGICITMNVVINIPILIMVMYYIYRYCYYKKVELKYIQEVKLEKTFPFFNHMSGFIVSMNINGTMKKVETKMAPAAIGPYSQAVIVGNLIFTSGQIPLNPETGKLEGENITEQTHRVCQNLKAVLEAAGASLQSAVKTVCFLQDMADFAAFNQVYAQYFTEKPARSCVAVKDLPKGALVEVEVVAQVEG